MKIAILDDGINPEIVPQYIKLKSYRIEDGEIIKYKETEKLTHGTICAYILQSHTIDCKIISIKVLDSKTKKANIKDLLTALHWCIKNNIKLINMSLGSSNFHDKNAFDSLIKSLGNKVIIVAACNNQNTITYPASIDRIIGVRYDKQNCIRKNCFFFESDPIDGINVTSFVEHEEIEIDGIKFEINGCNSFTTPYITAKVNNYMNEGYDTYEKIIEKLKMDTVDGAIYTYKYYKEILHWNEHIDIPIILNIIGEDSSGLSYCQLDKIKNLFIEDGYNCIFISDEHKKCITYNNFVSNVDMDIELIDLIKLYINFTKSDILLLSVSWELCKNLINNNIIDIILNYNENINIKNKNIEIVVIDSKEVREMEIYKLYKRIRNLFHRTYF